MADKKSGTKSVASNRKAFHDYFVEERLEAGIALSGTEVKSVRSGSVNLKDSFCVFKDGECWIRGMHISAYDKGNIFNKDPLRLRRLLLHKREIRKFAAAVERSGYTVVPLSVYLKDALVKVELGLCKGKKNYDKRDSIADRDASREISRELKSRNRYNKGGNDDV
ncbi:MAG: SsrA-binding protein SmpB [Oscillospiraceae bacterium]|jgi:SsrA-binding protein|nr:SsrA-binding protein SmpB [Oscillospiraceae bacterium]